MKRILLPLALLAACSTPDLVAPPVEGDTCAAASYAGLVGNSIAAVTLPADLNHRVIGPDTAVTMDFNPERLNINVDAQGTIESLTCG